ncbi:MAG: hypothetical protein CME59_11630 [Halioglobus sp.]|nr:hypothetical protein [Halioglobus sp.]|tara:strand:+ start:471 stop:1418 length:948 start_codon:yes stop_codon:yes gene_type:complete
MRRWLCRACLLLLACASFPAAPATDTETLWSNGSRLELRISPEFSRSARRDVREWIVFSAGALEQVFGRWPRKKWVVSVSPLSASGTDPIPWAQVHREERDRVEFYVAPQASLDQLKSAWTGYHELAHLLLPYRGWGDTWFSEGLATYYQNLLQVRSGVIDDARLWQNLYEGFERGRADAAFDGQPLEEVSSNMRKQGGFMRVYWSGAWYFLKVDTRLRRQSGGALTLDRALQKLNECCGEQRLSVQQIVERLDRLNQVYLFTPLYEKMRQSGAMPDYTDLFASLGVSVTPGGTALAATGPGAALRRQIANPGTL